MACFGRSPTAADLLEQFGAKRLTQARQTAANRGRVKVELPRASSSRDKTPPENLQLAVDAQGQFFLGKQAIAADALEDALRQQASKDPQPQLYIRGDKKAPYEFVADAMTSAQRAGLVKIGFVTEGKRP